MLCHTPFFAAMAGFADPGRPSSNGFVDHDTLPIRCHWERQADEARCQEVLQTLAEVWSIQVDGIGFRSPVPDSDGIFDAYLYDYADGGAYVYCSTWQDEDPGDGYTGCPGYMGLDQAITDAELQGYIAHEFNHVLQYATDYNEPTYPVWEGVASAAEIWTYPSLRADTIAYSFSDFQVAPWAGILNDGYFLWDVHGLWSYFEYGSAIWALHLDYHYGDGLGSGGAALWEGLAQGGGQNTVDVIDGYQAASSDWRDALLHFAAERVLIGTSAAPAWLPEQDETLRAAIDGVYSSAELPVDHSPTVLPYTTGAVYLRMEGLEGPVEVSVDADEGTWGLVAVSGGDLYWEQAESLVWEQGGEVVFGVVNLDHDDFATTGDRLDLRGTQRELRLRIEDHEGGGGDSGDPPDSGDTGDSGELDEGQRPPRDDGEDGGGCGCLSSGRPAGSAWVLSLSLIIVGRRRR